MAKIKAKIRKELLVWAREEAGLSVDDAARRIRTTPERLRSWEEGKDQPTVNQLRKLSETYKRPLAAFYLSEVPIRFRVMQDFRRLPGEIAGNYSPKLRLEFRNAELCRDLAIDLQQELELPLPNFEIRAELHDEPEEIAHRIREALKVDPAIQLEWRETRVAFNEWRGRMEAIGIMVLQAIDVPIEEMRGFSISRDQLPVVVANRKDSYTGRSFSLLHEFTHLMLRRSGICDIEEEAERRPEEQQVEVFCNRVAGAALLPRELLLQDPIVREAPNGRIDWPDESLEALARRYAVSREVVVRRLLIVGRTTEAFYVAIRARYLAEHQQRVEYLAANAGEFRRNMSMEAISHFGPAFVRLVLSNYHQRRITLNDVSAYLGVGLKHIPAVEKAIAVR